ncbi:unnamed protein product [Cyprideis torosa]|uniref:non-specific serine/threonine protein kinase n=1 Tax=Cyprideis torosa TaxID=163714 RepID=A0A7R8W6S1_9CRUS|nr:unnamed protein product [Cyprideis torosa]CAG0886822.1 unnamed protein product [Cyprideis torosa]
MVTPKKLALLVVDVQNHFRDVVKPVVGTIQELVRAFRAKGLPVVFTQHHDDGESHSRMLEEWWATSIVRGSHAWQLLPQMVELLTPTDIRITEKSRYDSFFMTSLEERLLDAGVDTVVVTGCITHMCCETTARGAFVRDFRVIFVSDANADISEQHQKATLRNLSSAFAYTRLLKSEDFQVLEELHRGNFGRVVVARTVRDQQLRVLKEITFDPQRLRDEDPSPRGLRELVLLMALRHPHLVELQGYFLGRGSLTMVLPFYEGGDLYTRIRERKRRGLLIPEITIRRWTAEIVSALKVTKIVLGLKMKVRSTNAFGERKSTADDSQNTFWMRVLAGVNLSGLGRLTNPNSCLVRKLIWIAVLVVCFITMLVQCYDRLVVFMGAPTMTNIQLHSNASMLFPSFTVCPVVGKADTESRTMFNETAVGVQYLRVFGVEANLSSKDSVLTSVGQLVEAAGGIDKVWGSVTYDIKSQVNQCFLGRNTYCEDVGELTSISTAWGSCLTFPSSTSLSQQGFARGLYLRMNPDFPDHKILFHLPGDLPVIKLDWYKMLKGTDTHAALSIKEYNRFPTSEIPCMMDSNQTYSQCMNACFERNITQVTGCRLAYMQELSHIPWCNTSESFLLTETLVRKVLEGGDDGVGAWDENRCPCNRPCHQLILETYVTLYPRYDLYGVTRAAYMDNLYEEMVEVRSFTTIAFLCEIGGSLSLLLGASILTYLHECRVLHRDLKTKNIFLAKGDSVRVGDFGIAKLLEDNFDGTKTIVGTPYYMCPEMFCSSGYTDACDIWSLGCCIFEMAALKPPFLGSSLNHVILNIIKAQIPPLPSGFSPSLTRLVHTLLQIEPSNRPTAEQLSFVPYIATARITSSSAERLSEIHRPDLSLSQNGRRSPSSPLLPRGGGPVSETDSSVVTGDVDNERPLSCQSQRTDVDVIVENGRSGRAHSGRSQAPDLLSSSSSTSPRSDASQPSVRFAADGSTGTALSPRSEISRDEIVNENKLLMDRGMSPYNEDSAFASDLSSSRHDSGSRPALEGRNLDTSIELGAFVEHGTHQVLVHEEGDRDSPRGDFDRQMTERRTFLVKRSAESTPVHSPPPPTSPERLPIVVLPPGVITRHVLESGTIKYEINRGDYTIECFIREVADEVEEAAEEWDSSKGILDTPSSSRPSSSRVLKWNQKSYAPAPPLLENTFYDSSLDDSYRKPPPSSNVREPAMTTSAMSMEQLQEEILQLEAEIFRDETAKSINKELSRGKSTALSPGESPMGSTTSLRPSRIPRPPSYTGTSQEDTVDAKKTASASSHHSREAVSSLPSNKAPPSRRPPRGRAVAPATKRQTAPPLLQSGNSKRVPPRRPPPSKPPRKLLSHSERGSSDSGVSVTRF